MAFFKKFIDYHQKIRMRLYYEYLYMIEISLKTLQKMDIISI